MFVYMGKEKTPEKLVTLYRYLQGNWHFHWRKGIIFVSEDCGKTPVSWSLGKKSWSWRLKKKKILCLYTETTGGQWNRLRSTQSSELWRYHSQEIISCSLKEVLLFLVIFWRTDDISFTSYSELILCCMAFNISCIDFR